MLIFLGPQSACTLSANENACGCLYQHFQAADICAPYGKCAPPANAPPHNHSELKVFGSVFYIHPGASVSAIYCVCSGELFEAILADTMCVSGGSEREAETTGRLSHCG